MLHITCKRILQTRARRKADGSIMRLRQRQEQRARSMVCRRVPHALAREYYQTRHASAKARMRRLRPSPGHAARYELQGEDWRYSKRARVRANHIVTDNTSHPMPCDAMRCLLVRVARVALALELDERVAARLLRLVVEDHPDLADRPITATQLGRHKLHLPLRSDRSCACVRVRECVLVRVCARKRAIPHVSNSRLSLASVVS